MDYGYGGYSTTSYGAQGGAGGGGFIPGESGSQQNSPSGNKGYSKDTLRPVTIKQINDADLMHQDGDFKIDGTEITQITFIGQIRNISQQTTNITYRVDDGTGTVEVKEWVDSDMEAKPKLVENQYARVYGKLKAFNNKKHVGAHSIRPIADLNEISYHLLEATVVHLYFTRGPLEQGGKTADAANGGYGQQQTGYANMGMAGDAAAITSMSANARKVYNCIKTSPQTNEGLHVQDIASRLGMETSDVMKAGDELLGLGQIYTTLDDQTWALMDV